MRARNSSPAAGVATVVVRWRSSRTASAPAGLAALAALLVLGAVAGSAAAADAPAALTPILKAAGWRMLFDGKTTEGWRGYKQEKMPAQGWIVEDGCLKCTGEKGGDIISIEQFGDFEMEFEWKVPPKGNSGVMYRVTEKHQDTWQTGPEYQVLDDEGHGMKPSDWHSAGAMYELVAPPDNKPVRPAGEFDLGRIRVYNGVAQHWLNGVKTAECRIDDAAWKEKIAAAKMKDFEGFGMQPKGHIALQDHGGFVWYRNVRVRSLDKPAPGETALFNGKDLSGWKAWTPENSPAESTWSVRDGVLICTGTPTGFIKTDKAYKDFVLKLEWRWSPETKKGGNSGVLLRVQGEDKVWPQCVEAQLQSGSAGDFWAIGDYPLKAEAARTNGRNVKKMTPAERAPGEWNDYEIIVAGPNISLRVNGELVNAAWDVADKAGPIALQSEGTEIQFRNVRIVPIE